MPDDVNGVSAADAERLYALVEEACAVLATCDADRVFAVVKDLDLAVGTDWSDQGTTMTYDAPAKLVVDSASFGAALGARTREARVTAFAALAVLREETAAALFGRALPLRMEGSYQISFEANVHRAMWMRWKPLAERLPPATLGELFLAGRFELSALSDEQVRAIPGEALMQALFADALPYPSDRDVERLLALHPWLDLDGRGKVAERLARTKGHFARFLMRPVMSSLIRARHTAAEPAALAYCERVGARDPYALSLLIGVGHRPSLERLVAELPKLARKPRRWDPHHVDPELGSPIRAGFALDPTTASARFARYFSDDAVKDDRGCKVASDIWMVGVGRTVDHLGTRLATGDGPVIVADRGWAPIAARLARHPRLGRAARSVVELTAEHPRALIAAEALPASTWSVEPARSRTSVVKKGAAKKASLKKKPAPSSSRRSPK